MKIKALLKKELSFYLNNPLGYIVGILFAAFVNLLFVKDLFLRGNSSMRPFFDILPWAYLVFIPSLTMRIFSEEKRINTIETLLTLPVTEIAVVIAKFLALLIFSAISLGLTFSIPITLKLISNPQVTEILVSYIGALFLAASFISISMFFSSASKNQIVAFLSSVITIFILIIIGTDFSSSLIPHLIHEKLNIFSPIYHFSVFLKGILDLGDCFYFISLTGLFLFFTIVNLERRD